MKTLSPLMRIGAIVALLLSAGCQTTELSKADLAKCPAAFVPPSKEEVVRRMGRENIDRGVMYRISKSGNSGFLFGSLHVSRLDWFLPGPRTVAALKSSNVLALEINIFEPEIAKQLQTPPPSSPSAQLSELPASVMKKIEAVAKKVCAPLKVLKARPPGFVLPTLILFDARFEGYEAALSSEAVFAGFAKGAKIPVKSLETVEQHLSAMNGTQISNEKAVANINKTLDQIISGENRRTVAAMANAWARGDIEGFLEACNDGCSGDAMKSINDARNPRIAAGIDALLSDGKRVFAAVGILHMTGPKAVPTLLRDKGYLVQRVQFGPLR